MLALLSRREVSEDGGRTVWANCRTILGPEDLRLSGELLQATTKAAKARHPRLRHRTARLGLPPRA